MSSSDSLASSCLYNGISEIVDVGMSPFSILEILSSYLEAKTVWESDIEACPLFKPFKNCTTDYFF